MRTLLARGLTASEITTSLEKFGVATIERDIAYVRDENAKWWHDHISLDSRSMSYLKEEIDHLREVRRQAWQAWQDAISRKDSRKEIAALNCLISVSKVLTELLGFTGISISDIEAQKEISEIREELEELRKLAEVAHAPANQVEP